MPTPTRDSPTRVLLALSQDSFSTAGASTTGSSTAAQSTSGVGWGAAARNPGGGSEGETWNQTTGSNTLAINTSNQGTSTGTTSISLVTLGSQTTADAEALVRVSATNANDGLGIFLRKTASTTYYRFRTGSTGIVILKTVAGTTTTLATGTYSWTGASTWIRARVLGSSLYVKAWADGSTEPAAWSTSITDSSIAGAGSYGLLAALNVTTHTATYDSFVVTQATNTTVSRDVPTRVRLQAVVSRDVPTRALLQAVVSRDVPVRTRLQAVTSRDISTRTRLQILTARDVSLRAKVQAVIGRDASVRTRLQAVVSRDVSLRTRLQAVISRDVPLRTRLQAVVGRDVPLRARLQAVLNRDIPSRVVLFVAALRDVPLRARLQAVTSRDISMRARLQVLSTRNVPLRTRLQAVIGRDIGARVLLYLLSTRDIRMRARLQAVVSRDISARVVLFAITQTPVARDLACRIVLVPNPSQGVLLFPLPAPSAPALPGAVLPLGRLSLPNAYAAGGVTLPDMPTVATAPFVLGNSIPTGSVFSLQWSFPSSVTQAALADGNTVSLTFPVYPGDLMVTGLVQVASSLSGSSIFQVTCTTLAPITINVRKVVSQFF